MFVLMDIEWIENRCHHISPTQIAAMRVDEHWNCQDQFYSRIAPRDPSFHNWNHMAYIGGTPSEFLYARGIYRVLTEPQSWLCEDDVICFWYADSRNILKSIYNLIFKSKVPQRIVVLGDYLFPFLAGRKMKIGNAYALCDQYGLQAVGPKHHAANDVAAMWKALGYIQYPTSLLYDAPPRDTKETSNTAKALEAVSVPDAMRPYQLEVETGVFHKADCSAIPDGAVLTGHPDLKYFFRKKLQACPYCMKEEVRKGLRERNRDIIERTQYQFIYTEHSEVFHRRGCSAILSTTDMIQGSVYYDAAAKTGRRPCKLCAPDSGTWRSMSEKKRAKRAAKAAAASTMIPDRAMNLQEQRAYARYTEARTERFAAAKDSFASETEKNDFYTLTQPRFAFFCGAGYQTFHKRSCQKLRGLSSITGFSRYQDAIRSGHTPCKVCKPTAKLDIACSIPITNRRRAGEAISDLEALCGEQGYTYQIADQCFCFATAVGKWKIDFSTTPYIVYHINLVRDPDGEQLYHRQPRLFLSLLDAFAYIQRHDRQLMGSTPGQVEQRLPTATE